MATAEELQKQIDAMQVKLQELQSSLEKSQTMTRDAYLQILNTKTVGVNGKLGGLSSADTLSSAPVGDVMVLKNALKLGGLSNEDTLSNASVGDAKKLRKNIGALGNEDIGSLAKKDFLNAADVKAMPENKTLMDINMGGDESKIRQRMGLGASATKGFIYANSSEDIYDVIKYGNYDIVCAETLAWFMTCITSNTLSAGAYIFAVNYSFVTHTVKSTGISGADLRSSGAAQGGVKSGGYGILPGTWSCKGYAERGQATLYVREMWS